METEGRIESHSINTAEVGDADYRSACMLVENEAWVPPWVPPWESTADVESGDQRNLEESFNGGLVVGERGGEGGNGEEGGGALENTKEDDDEEEEHSQTQNSAQSHNDIDRLSSLPDEIILTILTFIDVSDLFALIKTSHRLRNISLDPLLHQQRLIRAKNYLAHALPHRPPLDSLRSPRRIWLSRRDYTSRELSRGLLKIRLNKKLGMRPNPGVLVERGVLKGGYLKRCGSGGNGGGGEEGERQKSGEGKTGGMIANKQEQELEQGKKEGLTSNGSCSTTTTTSVDRRGTTRIVSNQDSSTGFTSSSPQPQNNLSHTPHDHHNQYTYYLHISPTLLPTCMNLEKQLLRDRLANFVRTLPPSPELAQEKLVKNHILPPPPPPPSPQSLSSSSSFPSSFALYPPAHDPPTHSHLSPLHPLLHHPHRHPHHSSSSPLPYYPPFPFASLLHPPTPPTTSQTPLKRPSVRYLIKRYSFRAQLDPGKFFERESRWGRGAEGRRRRKWERRERVGEEVEGAGRQKVGALRRFYERLGSSGGGAVSGGGRGGKGGREGRGMLM